MVPSLQQLNLEKACSSTSFAVRKKTFNVSVWYQARLAKLERSHSCLHCEVKSEDEQLLQLVWMGSISHIIFSWLSAKFSLVFLYKSSVSLTSITIIFSPDVDQAREAMEEEILSSLFTSEVVYYHSFTMKTLKIRSLKL